MERLCAKLNKLKALRIYPQKVRFGPFAHALIHNAEVDRSLINFGYVLIGHDTSVSLREECLY